MASLAKAFLVFAPLVSGSSGVGVCTGGAAAGCPTSADEAQSLMQLEKPARRHERRSGAGRQLAQLQDDARQQEFSDKLPAFARSQRGREAREKEPYACPLPTEECHLGDDETCELEKMSSTAVHAVYPHGATLCLNSEVPYHFLVKRGTYLYPAKLLLVFESGGACWDQDSYRRDEYTCEKEPMAQPWDGVLDFSNPHNPYHDYTIVRVLYCSGDLYAGNGQADWAQNPDGSAKTVYFRGYENTKATLKWVSEQFPNLQKLTVMGYAAGALGLQYWADAIIREFEERHPTIVVQQDSFTGIIFPTEEANLKLLQKAQAGLWGTCDNDALLEGDQTACKSGDFTWQGYFHKTMQRHRDVLFALINSKSDWEQIAFNSFFYSFPGAPTAQLAPGEWYVEATLLHKVYATNPNVRIYLINGDVHGHLAKKSFFTATPLGSESDDGKEKSLLRWISAFEAWRGKMSHVPCDHICFGASTKVSGRSSRVPYGNTWCEAAFATYQ